nr:hypothetical protein [Tanacetum cinerariifolium]
DEESDGDETREEDSFDQIPRTPEDSEDDDDGNGEEDQGLRISEEERIHKEEEADELYRDSSSVSSQFVTCMLNPTSDAATITTISHAPIPPTTIPSDVLQNIPTFDSVFCFEDRLKLLEANFSKYIQTNPFAKSVSNILADLSEIELKKILIEKMEGNKSIQRSDEQRNLYKALVEAYKANKIILDTYGECVILKRRRDDDDDDDQGEGPFAGSDRGSKRQREGKEPELASAPLQTATRSAGRSTTGSKSRQASASEFAFVEEPVQTTSQIEEPSHLMFETGAEDQPIVQHLSILNGSLSQRNLQLWIEPLNYDKHALWGVSHWGRKHQQFYGFAVNRESTLDVYSKRRIIAVTDLKIVEWHSYKHLD